MPFRPLYDYCLIKRKAAAEKYGSIFIPDIAKSPTVEGTVVAVGKGISNHIHGGWHTLCVKAGDRVLFTKNYMGDADVDLDGNTFYMLREDDIAASVAPDGSIAPMHDRVFVDRKTEADRFGSVLIPDSAREKTTEGTVVAVGSGKILESGEMIPLELKIGEHILFANKYVGQEIEFDGRKVLVMRQGDIAAVLDAE